MRRFLILFLPILALAATWATPAYTRAAGGITDDGHFFSADTIQQAENLIKQNHAKGRHREIRVVTVPAIPDDLQDEFKSQGKSPFFEHWAEDIGKRDKVDGVVILICKDPAHLQTVQGNETREKTFLDSDRRELDEQLTTAFRAKHYDEGILEAIRFIEKREDANVGNRAVPPAAAQPWSNTPIATPTPSMHSLSVGSWLCVGIGILLVVFLIIGAVARRGYGGRGYGAPPPGGYPPGYSGGAYPGGGYPQGGGYFGGANPGGGGFGRSFLGGLLGGAVGAWGYDKLTGRENPNPNYPPGTNPGTAYGSPPPDPTDQPDSSYSGSGSDFGSPPDSSSGGDFGSSPDSGGGDFGGGDSGGGGGGDFGGGDSGSSGGDF